MSPPALVLGVETSCDETAAAVVRRGVETLSNVVASQVEAHRPYGGVVPELASREHVSHAPAVVAEAIARAGVAWHDIDAVAVTYGPGLASSLLVGVASATALAMRLERPLIGINHLEAHLCSIFLGPDAPAIEATCPYIALLVSGGNTCLVRVDTPGRYAMLGQTMDDAAGEAFDKGATLLGLGYPGGPAIDRAARDGDPTAVRFPRALRPKGRDAAADRRRAYNFSFSGLKTALLYHLRDHPATPDSPAFADIAASYQEAAVDVLVDRCRRALRDTGIRHLAAVGGVSLNSRLRARLRTLTNELDVQLHLARPEYCMDNAAMIAGLAGLGCGRPMADAETLDIVPSLAIEETST